MCVVSVQSEVSVDAYSLTMSMPSSISYSIIIRTSHASPGTWSTNAREVTFGGEYRYIPVKASPTTRGPCPQKSSSRDRQSGGIDEGETNVEMYV